MEDQQSRKKNRWRGPIFAVAILLLAVVMLLPAVFGVCDDARRMQSQNSLKSMAVAMRDYLEEHQSFPPASIRDATGKPLLSWRVLLLPKLGEEQLYKEFHLNEPWDSPHNLTLLRKMPNVYRLPYQNAATDLTHYQVLVGPGTAFERPGLNKDDFPDGFYSTIFVVEAEEAVPWTKPVDLTYVRDGPLPGFYKRNKQRS